MAEELERLEEGGVEAESLKGGEGGPGEKMSLPSSNVTESDSSCGPTSSREEVRPMGSLSGALTFVQG